MGDVGAMWCLGRGGISDLLTGSAVPFRQEPHMMDSSR